MDCIRRKDQPRLRRIQSTLNIPKSTLSGWFKSVTLTVEQKASLAKRDSTYARTRLAEARKKAVIWHNAQKKMRMLQAVQAAQQILNDVKMTDKKILELVLAAIYMGEGFKAGVGTGMGNSNPLILKFFITALQRVYKIPTEKVRCELHLRADQDAVLLKRYWSRELRVPLQNFTSTSFDQRTRGIPTYPTYKGVCIVRCGRADIQRKLLALSMLYCEQIVSDYMGG